MMSKRSHKKFDALVSRVLFFEFGVAAFVLTISSFFLSGGVTSILFVAVSACSLTISLLCFTASLYFDDKRISIWAENTGNHEILIIFVAAAWGIATVIRGGK
jgi:hypothetical protein